MRGSRILAGDAIELTTRSSVAAGLVAYARIVYDDGANDKLRISDVITASDLSVEVFQSKSVAKRSGWVYDAVCTARGGTTPKRGQTYARLSIDHDGAVLCRGYIYSFVDLMQGQLIESGPGGGEGFIEIFGLATDAAPADITHTLATTNIIRRIFGFVVYYHCSSDVAARTIRVSIRKLGPVRPTGFTTGANNTQVLWPSAGALALAGDQEGTIFAYGSEGNDGIALSIDNGVKTVEDLTTDPDLFPYWVNENEKGELFFDLTNEEAADRWSVAVFRESWVNP